MKIITILSFFFIFSLIHCMEKESYPLRNDTLEKIVKSAHYTSLDIVILVKKFAQQNDIPLIPQSIGQLFGLDSQKIDTIFLENIKDKQVRSLMLSMGANINARTEKGKNCLWKIKDPQLLKELIKKGADVNAIDNKGCTPLGSLSNLYSGKNNKNAYQKLPAARILLKYGANPNLKNSNYLLYEILLFSPTNLPGLDAIKLFVHHKMTISIQNTPEYNPLLAAIIGNNHNVVDFLLKNKADPNLPNAHSEYPLHIALGTFHDKTHHINHLIVMLLLQYGAAPSIPYHEYEMTPLDVAYKHKNNIIINALLKRHAQTYSQTIETTMSQSREKY